MAEIKSGTSVLCFVCSYLFRVRAHCKILFHDKELLPGNPAATDFCCVCVRGFIPSAHRIDVAPTMLKSLHGTLFWWRTPSLISQTTPISMENSGGLSRERGGKCCGLRFDGSSIVIIYLHGWCDMQREFSIFNVKY
jgi:hypothetical protein